jgi:hypothetical protein
VKALAEVFWQRHWVGVAVDLNCFAARIHYQPALFAALEMLIEFCEALGVQFAIQIAGKFLKYSAAVHASALR